MMKKRLLSTLLALCMVLVLLPVTALAAETSGSCGENVTWSYSDGTLTIQGTGKMTDYPGHSGWEQAEFAPWYDHRGQLHTVIIKEGITSIGDYAFYGCYSLTNVAIPDGITIIGNNAFESCESLTGVTIPDSVTTISDFAFNGCFSLTGVTIPGSVTSIGNRVFTSCESLISITIPASVATIGVRQFYDCGKLTDIYYGGNEDQWARIYVDGVENADVPSNATIHYNSAGPDAPTTPTAPATPAAPVPEKVVLSPQNLAVDGREIDCEKYNIDGSNYFKLRDLAQLLSGTGSQFEVSYDAAASAVTITTGAAYTPAGGELATGVDNSSTAQPSAQSILIDGTAHGELTVYNIGGSNFFQLRELGNILGFEVGYDLATNTATVSSR